MKEDKNLKNNQNEEEIAALPEKIIQSNDYMMIQNLEKRMEA